MFTAVALGFMLLVSLTAQLPGTVAPGWLRQHRDTYAVLWPQGWAFFTSPPLADVTVAYRVRAAELVPATPALSDPTNLWGVRRGGYTRLLEIVRVARSVPEPGWRACPAGGAAQCLRAGAVPVTAVVNPTHPATLCGRVVFAVETPEPWRSARPRNLGARQVRRIAVADVTCPE